MVSLSPPVLALRIAVIAAAIGALSGARGLVDPAAAGASDSGPATGSRAQAAGRFFSHAVVVVALWRAPPVGACMAAALGSGWLGAAAVDAARALRVPRAGPILAGLGAAALGVALWRPLWLYLAAIRAIAAAGAM